MTQRDPEQVTILHLSDMQFGRNHRFRALDERTETSPDAILETLLTRLTDDLRLLKDSHGIRADLVVMSGDLTEWGLRTEFGQVRRFIDGLAHNLGLPRRCFVLLPGNHDVNRKLCESYFSECEGRETVPAPPYFRKWEPFVDLFREVYASDGDIQFTEEEPWSLFVYQEHRLVVAAFNSTMAESHRAEDHFGQLGERQLRWFAERLRAYRQQVHLLAAVVGRNLEFGDGLRQEHRRFQVDLHHFIERFFGDLDQLFLALDADAVHQDIDLAVVFRSGCDCGANAVGGMRIDGHGAG